MSWPLFAVLQLTVLTVGISVAFVLRNRSLKQRYLALAEGLEAAETAIEQAQQRTSDGAEQVWLKDRIGELTGEDEISAIQRLVLEQELEADEGFEEKLTKKLSSAAAAQEALGQQWQVARETAAELAASLVDKYPLSHPVITQLHEAYDAVDAAFALTTPPLPDAPEVTDVDGTDAAQEAEHLRATNELLQQQLDKAQTELSDHAASGMDAEAQAEDLRGLLQQFTKDSRDMMACIQKLEAENANLRQQLGLGGAEAPAEEAEAASAGADAPAQA